MNYIIFDLEATCWENDRTKQNEIIEIGAVKMNTKLEFVDEFQTFIKPKVHPWLSDFCKELTSITQENVNAAPYFPQAIGKFQEWIGKEDYFLCSWGFYDKSQLKKDCELNRVRQEWIKNHISIKHQHGKMIGNERGVGMERALHMLKLQLDGTHHRGIDDARNIAKIFIKIFDKLELQ
ncbi:3'-5' exonuclease [Paenibacillus planticolens]|uniref:3'-5' exonuclease n=1 Tax=Paenibacillus planticolens TaxID=2654976 RepID=A0ABX1ZJA4_9BACL|nr:3'-5' exonuclease [Paenibacillus planticolens]NOU98724.1 3'-5' exonuclease [Paenibacillus planticolens]